MCVSIMTTHMHLKNVLRYAQKKHNKTYKVVFSFVTSALLLTAKVVSTCFIGNVSKRHRYLALTRPESSNSPKGTDSPKVT